MSDDHSYSGEDINTVLTTVERITTWGDTQLSLMAHAFVIACKSTQVDRKTALEQINQLWDREDPLVPLHSTQ